MKQEEIIIVGGVPRSGTSLMMKMLHIGGLAVVAENFASYEDNRANDDLLKSSFLLSCRGKAVKILDLQRKRIPVGLRLKVIWMKRDYEQQAKSCIKFIRNMTRIETRGKEWMQIAVSIFRDELAAFKAFKRHNIPFEVIQFEDCIKQPEKVVDKLQKFLPEFTLNCEAMLKVPLKRDVKCALGMQIEVDLVKALKK